MDFVPHTSEDQKQMLQAIGLNSLEELFQDIDPQILLKQNLNLPLGLSEPELVAEITALAEKNKRTSCSFLGAGAYQHFIPAVVPHLVGRSEFYTAYTPYQAEIAQGMLQAIYEYQSCICRLTGMDVANASMYDGASAMAEAAIMAITSTKRKAVLVSKLVHPEWRHVLRTYLNANNAEVQEVDFLDGLTNLSDLETKLSDSTAAVIVQNPNFFGSFEDLQTLSKITKAKGAVFIVAIAEPTSLGLIKPPGEFGVDIVAAEGQSFGNPISFGGPYLGVMATTNELVRKIPGRLVGSTYDKQGRRGYTLTLQAREQHIRREKATSNICSNEALCALTALIYLVTLGKNLKKLAELNIQKAHYAADQFTSVAHGELAFPRVTFYNEFVIKTPDAKIATKKLHDQGIIGGLELDLYYPELSNCLLMCVTEIMTKEQIDRAVDILS